MANSLDSTNCIKNLIQLMCCDGKLDKQEKKFLTAAAKQMQFQVDDWPRMIKEVYRDQVDLYPVTDRQKAVATLKGLIVMAKADGQVHDKEKQFIQKFAKSIGVSNSEWKQIVKSIDKENLFESFVETDKNIGTVTVVKDGFEKIDDFCRVARENGATVETVEMKAFLESKPDPGQVACFHAAADKETSMENCRVLLEKTGGNLICILTRFQGLQVKYLHELGLKKCIIEPVYSQDILNLFKW
jgi:uncharacterized tellurite resistance protein B-like protein